MDGIGRVFLIEIYHFSSCLLLIIRVEIIILCLSLEDTNEIPFYILSFIFLYVFFYNLLGKFNDKNSFSELFFKISILNEIVSRKMNLMKLDEYFSRDLSFRIFLWRIRRNFFLYSVSSVLHIDDSRLRFPIVFQNIDTQSKLY